MGSEQIAVRLPGSLLSTLDGLVARGLCGSRAAVVRAGIEAIAALEERRRVDAALVDAYCRTPPGAAEDEAAVAPLRQAIAEETW